MITKTKDIIGLTLLLFAMVFFSSYKAPIVKSTEQTTSSKIESFTFTSNGITKRGKIYLPDAYKTNKNLPAIYLIDYTEQHFKVATDEFEKVIDAVKQIEGFDALVISLENIEDIDATPETFQSNYDVFKNLTAYVDDRYTNNASRTFIGRGSEASIVLMTLFLENSVFENFIATDPSPKFTTAIENILKKDDLPKFKRNRKLHFSFSTADPCGVCTKLNNLIKKVEFPWLEMKSIEYSDNNYENTYPISFAAGINYIFIE